MISIRTKSDKEEIRVERSDYKGRDYMSVRKWFRADSGDWLPTKKGITFEVEYSREVIEAMIAELKK